MRFGIFELTRREQRVVILIVLVLVGFAVAKHYRNQRQPLLPTPPSVSEPAMSPTSLEEEPPEAGD